jgi:hypothetical protein
MLKPMWILAQVVDRKEVEAMRDAAKASRPKFLGTDFSVLLAVVLALSAILFFWAFFLRRRPKTARGALVIERADKHKHSKEAFSSSGRRKRRKRRPEHPDNWGRNPTLGETGGLPPVRPEEPDEPEEPETPPPGAPRSPSAP